MKKLVIFYALVALATAAVYNKAYGWGGFVSGFVEQNARNAELKLYGTDTGRYSTPKPDRPSLETFQVRIDGRTYVCVRNNWENYSSTDCH